MVRAPPNQKVHTNDPLRSAASSGNLDTMLQFDLLDEGWMLFENLEDRRSGRPPFGGCCPANEGRSNRQIRRV